jgi:hypothetical protein
VRTSSTSFTSFTVSKALVCIWAVGFRKGAGVLLSLQIQHSLNFRAKDEWTKLAKWVNNNRFSSIQHPKPNRRAEDKVSVSAMLDSCEAD